MCGPAPSRFVSKPWDDFQRMARLRYSGRASRPTRICLTCIGQLRAALADAIGFRPEARPYSPHVTLARIEPAASCDGIDGYLAEHHEADLGHFAVNQFAQFSSHIKDDRPDYLQRSVYRLTE